MWMLAHTTLGWRLLLLLLLLTSMKTAVAPHCAMCAATPSGTHSIRMLILLPRSISLTVHKQQQQQQSEEHGIKLVSIPRGHMQPCHAKTASSTNGDDAQPECYHATIVQYIT
jgi:hypothetical protein